MHVLKLIAIVLGGVWSVELTVCVAVLAPVLVKARSERALAPLASERAAAFSATDADRTDVMESGVGAPLTAS